MDHKPVDVIKIDDIPTYISKLEKEMRRAAKDLDFETAAMPNHESLDCLYIINKDLEIQGKYIELSWHLDMSVGGRMQHICRRAISI